MYLRHPKNPIHLTLEKKLESRWTPVFWPHINFNIKKKYLPKVSQKQMQEILFWCWKNFNTSILIPLPCNKISFSPCEWKSLFFYHQNCCYLGDLDAGKAAMRDSAGAFSRLTANASSQTTLDSIAVPLFLRWNWVIFNFKNFSKVKWKGFRGDEDTNIQNQLRNQIYLIRFWHTEALI